MNNTRRRSNSSPRPPKKQEPTPRNPAKPRMFVNRAGSAERIDKESLCPILLQCGSCPTFEKNYSLQLQEKKEDLKHLCSELPALSKVPIRDCVPSPRTLGYRHSAKLAISGRLDNMDKKFREDNRSEGREKRGNSNLVSDRDDTPASRMWIEIGLYKPGSHFVQDIGHCPVQAEKLNALLGFLRGELAKSGIPVYSEATHRGILRHLVMRTNRLQNRILVTFVTTGEHPSLRPLARLICERFTQVGGVLMHINNTKGNAIFSTAAEDSGEGDFSGNDVVLAGNNALLDQLCGMNLRFSATSFMQVNPELAEKVYFRIQEIADPQPSETVVDLYCGVGSIGLALAQRAGRLIGIEETAASIDDARFNAEQNHLANTEFHVGRAEAVLANLIASGGLKRADVVTLNPSRRGCQKQVLDTIASLKPRMVLYMSCNPKTLVRDLALLDTVGYRTVSLEPFDMFPRTKHYEVLACLVPNPRKA